MMKQFKYEMLAQRLKEQIDQNKWQVNEKLPSIRELAASFCIAKVSVQKALHTLEADSIIYAKPKSGYYVAPAKVAELTNVNLKDMSQPKLITVPNVFHEIMARSAAFDIAPSPIESSNVSSHLLLLNRHLSRALRNKPQHNALYYSEPSGELSLRRQLSTHYRKRNFITSEDEICITSGCQNSLFLALSVTCQPGDIVAIESPAFYGALQLLQQLQLKVIELPCSTTTGLSASVLNEATKKWPIKACVLTANFATPTGATIPRAEKQALVKLAGEKNITIIEDDIYGDLGFHSNVEPLKAFDNNDNVILCSSFSKSLSRDLRIGWIIAGKQLNNIIHMKLVNQLSTSVAVQQGLTTFLAEGHFARHLIYYRKILLAQRNQLSQAISNDWGFPTKFTIPDGGLAIWVELPNEIDTFLLYDKAKSAGIILTPGRLFTSTKKFHNYLRLSFAHPAIKQRLQAIKTLGILFKEALRSSLPIKKFD